MSKEKRFVIQVDPLEIEDDAIYDNKELKLYECQSGTMSDICSLLNKQDKQIADLEAKLAESEKKYAELFCRNIELETLYSQKTARLNFYKDTDLVEENKQLKQQLEEKEKIEYTDTINFVETSEPDIVAKELDRLNEQLAEKDKEIEQLKKFDDLNKTFFNLFRTAFKEPDKVDDLFNALKTTQEKHNQDKISFAVEQLELAQKYIKQYVNNFDDMNDCLYAIDNQIKELKGEE